MSNKWTPAQENAINYSCSENGSAIVSAAAGSGKTAVLVERVIRMISDEVTRTPAESIVVVTFTVKAANELRSRLELALSGKIAETGSEWLEEQLIRLEDAKITTINSFCLDIVRQYSSDLGFSSDFAILGEEEINRYSDDALSEVMDLFYEDAFTEQERQSLRGLIPVPGDRVVEKLIRDLSRFLEKLPEPMKWLDEKYALMSDYEYYDDLLVKPLISEMRGKIDECVALTGESLSLAFSDTVKPLIEADYSLAKGWDNINYVNLDKSKIELLLKKSIGSSAYSKGTETKQVKEQLKENYKLYKKLISEIKDIAASFIALETVLEKQKPAIGVLIKLYKLYDDLLVNKKRAGGGMDFSDTEHFCLKLLRMNGGEKAKEIGSEYSQIIVDEFQDCNHLQCEIFRALSVNESNLFFVGDVKQLIYRFRSADPSIFIDTMKDEKYNTLLLNKNFRSNTEVINAVNKLFTGLMTHELGGVDYDENQRLESGLDISGGDACTAELCIVNSDIPNSEPLYIAKRIRDMVDEGFLIADKRNDFTPRKANYGDFAIITSALSPVEEVYIEALSAYGIPFVRGGKGDFASLDEIGLAIDFLKIVDNPYKDIELFNILLSPLYRFTANDIAKIRTLGKKKITAFKGIKAIRKICGCKGKSYSVKAAEIKKIKLLFITRSSSLYSDLISAKKSREFKTKISDFLSNLALYKAMSENYSVSRLIRGITENGLFLPLIATSANAEKTLANLRLLQYYSESYAELSGGTLTGFIKLLSDIRDNKIRIDEADASAETDEDNDNSGAVQLLTIHASKGLEFPICFVAGTNRSFNKMEISENIIFDREIGFAARYIDKDSLVRYDTLTHSYAKDKINAALLSEELRKLYVAATRARDKLIFTGAVKFQENDDDEPIKYKEGSYFNWIYNSSAVQINMIDDDEIPEPKGFTKPQEDTNEQASEDEKRIISERINKKYDREILTNIPRKLTATQIGVLRDNILETEDEPSIFPRTPSFIKDSRLTGKKRGDAYHKMMELIDFKRGDYENQIAELKESFTPTEFEAIDIEQITSFFNSPLGKRACESKHVEKEFGLYTELDDLTELGLDSEVNTRFSERPFIQGIADMFFYEGGKIILVDYKTNRNTTKNRLKEEYQKQLLIYKKAIQEMTETEVSECYIYSFELGEIKVTI